MCPNCTDTAVTRGQANRYHACRGRAGVIAPMVEDGFRGRVFTVEREDWVGQERVFLDGNGRPVMAVVTERPDGSNDVLVNVPAAKGGGHGGMD